MILPHIECMGILKSSVEDPSTLAMLFRDMKRDVDEGAARLQRAYRTLIIGATGDAWRCEVVTMAAPYDLGPEGAEATLRMLTAAIDGQLVVSAMSHYFHGLHLAQVVVQHKRYTTLHALKGVNGWRDGLPEHGRLFDPWGPLDPAQLARTAELAAHVARVRLDLPGADIDPLDRADKDTSAMAARILKESGII